MLAITRARLRSLRIVLLTATLGSTALATGLAHAGEVVAAAGPIATDGNGKITAEGRKAAVKELASQPGEEMWTLHLWAQIDKGAPGPLYVEFVGKLPDGKPYTAFSHEHSTYDGEKYINLEIDLEGNRGFNKGHTYKIEISQQNDKGKTIPLGSGSVTLKFTPAPKEDGGDGGKGKETEGEGDDQSEEQDELDSFAEGGGGGDGAPPPVTPPPKKKGCRVDPGEYAGPGVLALFVLGALTRRRRSSR